MYKILSTLTASVVVIVTHLFIKTLSKTAIIFNFFGKSLVIGCSRGAPSVSSDAFLKLETRGFPVVFCILFLKRLPLIQCFQSILQFMPCNIVNIVH